MATEEKVEVHPGDYRGVWYCSGRANLLPGKTCVYSGPMATYCAWHRPMAVFAPEVRTTFFVFGNADNAPSIGRYDHAEGRFLEPVVLGANPDGDAHRNPTLLVDETGCLTVFYGAHGHPTRVLRSSRPFDTSAWTARPEIPQTTYPQPWQLVSGQLFVSYRGGKISQEPGWRFQTSSDGARSWTTPTDLVTFPGCSIYAVTVAESGALPRKVHIAWSRLGGGSEEEIRTKHLWARRYDIYYAASEDWGQTWRRSDGSPYSLPIGEETADRIYDCGTRGVWLKDIQVDPTGRPRILFNDADPFTYESQWKVACLNAGGWAFSDVTKSDHMYDDGGLVILSEDDYRIYAPTTAAQPGEDGGEIETWQSRDGGASWRHLQSLTCGSAYSHNNVKVVYNHEQSPGGFRIFWSYGDSVEPPETREVSMFCYGEARERPLPITCPTREDL